MFNFASADDGRLLAKNFSRPEAKTLPCNSVMHQNT
jgi:hypothetical protein